MFELLPVELDLRLAIYGHCFPRLVDLELVFALRWLRAVSFALLGFLLPWLRASLRRRWSTTYVYPRPLASNACPRQVC